MITETRASIVFFGEKFSPAEAERLTGIHFAKKHERGDIGTSGRFKGKSYPFGHAVINPPKNDPNPLKSLVDIVLPHMNILRQLGATYGKMQITYGYQSQCNLEFEPEFLSKLGTAGIHLTITCIENAEGSVD